MAKTRGKKRERIDSEAEPIDARMATGASGGKVGWFKL
jgi:hypothetical protein